MVKKIENASKVLLTSADGRKVGIHEAFGEEVGTAIDEANAFMHSTNGDFKVPRASISIDDFERFFLNIFLYEGQEFPERDVVISEFKRYTNGYTYGVAIFDGDVEVAYIPPILRSEAINVGNGNTLKSLIENVTLERRNNKVYAESLLNKGLEEFSSDIANMDKVDLTDINKFRDWISSNYELVDSNESKATLTDKATPTTNRSSIYE